MPVFVGLFMSLAAVAVALLIAVTLPFGSWFPELIVNCSENGIDATSCVDVALKAGVYSTVAFIAVIAISVGMWRHASRWNAQTHTLINPIATKLFVAATMALVAAHYITQLYGPAFASRMDDIVRFVNFVALENLLWPILLQLLVTESDGRIRMGILTALVAIMALTPYRAVYLAILVFGFALPIITEIARDMRVRGLASALSRSAKPMALAALVFVCAVWSGYVDSAGRDLTPYQNESTTKAVQEARLGLVEFPDQTRTVSVAQAPQGQVRNILQRLVHPLIQAALVEHLAARMPLPSLLDELRWKFRLDSRLPLSQFLYEREYQSGQGVGGTTFLYYGEAAAYMPHMMLLWMIAAPLVIVMIWLALRAKNADIGTLCGAQLWRSSLAGIVTILPSFAIQVLTLLGMVSLSRLLERSGRLKRLSGASTSAALLAAAMLVGLQCWATVDGVSRDTILVMGLAPPQGCVFTNWVDMPHSVDAVLADHGVKVMSSVWIDARYADPAQRSRPLLIQVPRGHVAKSFSGEILDRLAANIHCADKPAGAPPRVITEHFFERKGNLPFELLVVGFGLVTVVSLFREMVSLRPEGNAMQTRVLN